MKRLYLKYIDEIEAPLEINIAARMRQNLQSIFTETRDTMDMKETMQLMESAVEEIVHLMTEAAIQFSLLEDAKRFSIHNAGRSMSDALF